MCNLIYFAVLAANRRAHHKPVQRYNTWLLVNKPSETAHMTYLWSLSSLRFGPPMQVQCVHMQMSMQVHATSCAVHMQVQCICKCNAYVYACDMQVQCRCICKCNAYACDCNAYAMHDSSELGNPRSCYPKFGKP